ncbi:OB-fold protein [Burkholderia multivorans]|uniref:OB-fold protein n=1 Tax=Burkholderia multivorans TaxID=87883 RepID=UPI0009B9F1BA|nr:OB-fold putative lipoprotein [Burkholderia multivorans]MCA8389224.1 OB-fold putative lipoprotein [Burkholderia multivorans]SAK33233.1 tRNA_anti-like protein [Burkholderia multivorans]
MGKRTNLFRTVAIFAAVALVSACDQHASTNAASTASPVPTVASSALTERASAPTTTASTPKEPAAPSYISVSAQHLYDEYHANEVLADSKYKGNWLYVQGIVAEIGKDFSDSPFVRLSIPENEFEGVRADFSKAATPTLANLHKGDSISLMCLGRGMIIGSPVLDCTREDAPPMPLSSTPAASTSHTTQAQTNADEVLEADKLEPQQSSSQQSQGGVLAMWVGGRDTNLRSCPGTSCAALIVIPKNSGLSVDTSSIQALPDAGTSWVRVTYSGLYCTPASIDPKVGCVNPAQTSAPVVGWVNYALLSQSPQTPQ